MNEHGGILCIDKPAEMTSFAGCAVFRRLLNIKKIGHAGTLDPNATGVLPLLVGRATKMLAYLPDHSKRYTVTLRFGFVSDTLDCWGTVESTNTPPPPATAVEAALEAFRGDIRQVPPMTSALKRNGQRLYDLARQGITVDRSPRPVTVHSLEMVSYDIDSGILVLDCACSKGTYMRSLCDDLGKALGCGGMMTALRRTEAAGFSLADCITLEDARRMAEAGTLADCVIPLDRALDFYPALTVSPAQATRFANGGALFLERLCRPVDTTVRVYSPAGKLIGLGKPEAGELKAEKIL